MSLHRLVSQLFECETRLVVRYPLAFVVVPLVFASVLIFAACYDFKLNQSKQSLEMFLPDAMESLVDLHELMALFPPKDALRDSYSLFGSKFAYVIFEDVSSTQNAIAPNKLKQIADLHKNIQNIVTDGYLKYTDLCYRTEVGGACVQHPILYAFEDQQAMSLVIQLMAKYPTLRASNVSVDNAIVFGGVRLANKTADKHGSKSIEAAKAIRLVYVLAPVIEADEWIQEFIKKMETLQYDGAKLFYTSSASLPKEMERNGALLIPWMPLMVTVLIGFCAATCYENDAVRSQPFIGLSAMFNASLAVCCSIATLIYIEYPFLAMVLIMPFLIISIGVDNMFLVLKSWRIAVDEHPEQLGRAVDCDQVFVYSVTEVSVSLFITSLTDGLSFLVGSTSDFIAVRVFCTYCALAILYLFLFQITLLNGLMAFHCRREIDGRHCFLFIKVPIEIANTSTLFTLFCGRKKRSVEHNKKSNVWSYVAHLMQTKLVKSLTFIFYIVYLCWSTHYLIKLPLGLDLKLLTPDGSYVAEELHAQERLFSDYGAFCYGVIRTTNLTLYKQKERTELVQLYNSLTSSNLVSKSEFWLVNFDNFANNTEFKSEKEFMRMLIKFLETPDYAKFRSDIKFNNKGHIAAVKMIMRIRGLGAENDPPRAKFMRDIMKHSKYDGFVYDTSFLLVDQQDTTLKNVIANVLIAVLVMLFISMLLIPRPASALSIILCIFSINLGVVGCLSAAGTRLDIISMITIVMAIGFSVDYATHLTFHYLIQKQNRLESALEVIAFPIVQAALSTLFGVAILGIVPSYMIRTFVLTVVFVVIIGLLHTLLFLPVLLATVVPNSEYIEAYQATKPHQQKTISNFQTHVFATKQRMDCYL